MPGSPATRQHDRTELHDLTETQSALARLAALTARGVSPSELFAAVTNEVRRRFGATTARMIRYESDGTATVQANDGTIGAHVQVGQEWRGYPETGLTRTVWTTGRPARVDDYGQIPGGDVYTGEGLIGAVGVPIFVHGTLWGLIAIGSSDGALPLDAEERLLAFTALTATAIATAQGRAEIAVSRARIVAASDELHRRLERDLHDGAQQKLVSLAMLLAEMSESNAGSSCFQTDLDEASKMVISIVEDLREMARAIHPPLLTEAGLGPALRALARRSAVPTKVRVEVPSRMPAPVELGAYFAASEMLTNAVKHAHANNVEIAAVLTDHVLRLTVSDDGVGAGDQLEKYGLIGLQDRVEALGGRLIIDSASDGGTVGYCEIPTRHEAFMHVE
ncbi:GAF domain-containing protein [Mycobacterium sp. 21AC1]|uniref:GAF domain-containing sensor histidine kinase n=1 Tax=[Mycobacterium] appelbergii TaxID=2939269 RepID=UPI002938FD37|nr:GAF domain-containing protein [Mycobacterium sp. 21AC1]MDV3125993.1 GAF domain-containing protein [Mycobacterium sp. 21AC1]